MRGKSEKYCLISIAKNGQNTVYKYLRENVKCLNLIKIDDQVELQIKFKAKMTEFTMCLVLKLSPFLRMGSKPKFLTESKQTAHVKNQKNHEGRVARRALLVLIFEN